MFTVKHCAIRLVLNIYVDWAYRVRTQRSLQNVELCPGALRVHAVSWRDRFLNTHKTVGFLHKYCV